MALIAELHLHGDIILFERTFERASGAECTFEDVHYVTGDDDFTHHVFFWWVTGTDPSTFETTLDADPTVSEHRIVAEIDGRTLYRIRTRSFPPDQSLVFPTFREHGVTTIEARRDADGLHLEARFRIETPSNRSSNPPGRSPITSERSACTRTAARSWKQPR